MCETRSCPHEADALCTCRALLERDNDIIGLLTHIHENMTDVEWELDYTDLSRPEKRRLCPGGQVPHLRRPALPGTGRFGRTGRG